MTENLDGTMNHFEVYTTTDKAKRDELFSMFRESTDPYEQQAVKFSGVHVVPGKTGVYQSTWSVAHPTERG